MDIALILLLVLVVYSVAVFLFMRFFAFIRNCDSEMRTMIGSKRVIERFPVVPSRKKRSKKVRAPRLAHA